MFFTLVFINIQSLYVTPVTISIYLIHAHSHDWPHDLLRSVTICYDLLRSDTFTTIRPRLRPRCNDCGTWTDTSWHNRSGSQQIATNRSGTYWIVTHRIQTWNFYKSKSSTISYDWLIVAYVTNLTTMGT